MNCTPRTAAQPQPNRPFLRALPPRLLYAVAGLWIAAVLVPLLALCFYAHPLYDDFFHTLPAAEAWARTGSLPQTLAAAWTRLLWLYRNWQGTFVAMALSVFTPMVFGTRWFFLAPLCTVLLLAGAAWYAVRSLTRFTLHLPWCDTLLAYAAFLTLWLGFLPGACEAVYWQSGMPYAVSGAALLGVAGLLLRLRQPGHRVRRMLSLAVLGVVLGGCPYPLALGGAMGLLLVCVWAFCVRSKARWGALIALLTTGAALALVLAAPGNGVRQERVGAAMAPLPAVLQSVAECLQTTGGWLTPQWLGIGLLAASLLLPGLRAADLRPRHPVWLSVLGFGALAAAFVPAIYATGVEGGQIDRIQATLYLGFVVYAAFAGTVWLAWRAGHTPAAQTGLSGWKLALCAVLIVWGLFAQAILTTPSVSATVSLLTGQAARYRAAMTARDEAIAAAPTPAEALQQAVDLEERPNLFRPDGMSLQREAVTAVTHRVYALQPLLEQYGAGQIPQAEWAALDAWDAQ